MTGGAAGAERRRLEDADHGAAWRRWGPYVSARQWGTVREDYSKDGEAWSYFPMTRRGPGPTGGVRTGSRASATTSRSSAWRLALWNGRDPILKERLFGLTRPRGQSRRGRQGVLVPPATARPRTRPCSYLYKYPQGEYPYRDLVDDEPGRRSRTEFEYELLDTGVFDDGRYFDVEVEYAKAAPEDLVMRVTVHNRGPEDAAGPPAAHALVPQHVVLAGCRRCAGPPARRGARRVRRVGDRGRAPAARPAATGVLRRSRACSSPRTRRTPSGSSGRPTPTALREGRHRTVTSSHGEARR